MIFSSRLTIISSVITLLSCLFVLKSTILARVSTSLERYQQFRVFIRRYTPIFADDFKNITKICANLALRQKKHVNLRMNPHVYLRINPSVQIHQNLRYLAVARKFRDEVGRSRRDRRNIVLTFYFLAEASACKKRRTHRHYTVLRGRCNERLKQSRAASGIDSAIDGCA